MTIYVSATCPKCRILKNELDKNNIPYEISMNMDAVIESGMRSLPVLQLNDGLMLTFEEGMNYIQRGGK